MMKSKFTKTISAFFVAVIAMTAASTYSMAAGLDTTSLQAGNSIGVIGNVAQAFIWTFNLFRYLGWAGVIVGVGMAIFSLIYKLFSGDSEEAMKQVSSYITKAVIIVVAGILLISAGFIIKQVGALIGVTATQSYTIEVVTVGGAGGGGGGGGGVGTCAAVMSGAACLITNNSCAAGKVPTAAIIACACSCL